MGKAAPGALGPSRASRRDRLGAGLFGLGERARQKGGEKTGKNPTDRGKPGSKRHLVSDRKGVPLAVVLTSANVHDSNVFEEVVDAIEPIKRPGRGRPRKRPEKLHADKGYDAKKCRKALRKRGIKSRIARKGKESSERLGRHRWVVERTLAWLARCTGGWRCVTSGEGHPRSVPLPRLFLDLPQLPNVRVLKCTLSKEQGWLWEINIGFFRRRGQPVVVFEG